MTDCPSCGAALKQGDWTCGRCGAPVAGATQGGSGGAGAPPGSYDYVPEYRPQPAPAAPAPSGASGAVRLVVIGAAVAVVAVVAVWFFVLRGGPSTSGEEFIGTWNATGSGIGSVLVTRPGDAFSVTLTGSQPEQTATVPAHIDGDELVITVDDFATMGGEGNAERFKDALRALAGDFSIVFSSVDATHLEMRIEGTSAAGQEADTTATLVKATP